MRRLGAALRRSWRSTAVAIHLRPAWPHRRQPDGPVAVMLKWAKDGDVPIDRDALEFILCLLSSLVDETNDESRQSMNSSASRSIGTSPSLAHFSMTATGP